MAAAADSVVAEVVTAVVVDLEVAVEEAEADSVVAIVAVVIVEAEVNKPTSLPDQMTGLVPSSTVEIQTFLGEMNATSAKHPNLKAPEVMIAAEVVAVALEAVVAEVSVEVTVEAVVVAFVAVIAIVVAAAEDLEVAEVVVDSEVAVAAADLCAVAAAVDTEIVLTKTKIQPNPKHDSMYSRTIVSGGTVF